MQKRNGFSTVPFFEINLLFLDLLQSGAEKVCTPSDESAESFDPNTPGSSPARLPGNRGRKIPLPRG